MKVRLKVDIDDLGKRGEEVEVTEDQGRIFICAGYATGIKAPPEATVAAPDEQEKEPAEKAGKKRRFLNAK